MVSVVAGAVMLLLGSLGGTASPSRRSVSWYVACGAEEGVSAAPLLVGVLSHRSGLSVAEHRRVAAGRAVAGCSGRGDRAPAAFTQRGNLADIRDIDPNRRSNTVTAQLAAPGWYPGPDDSHSYWDGSAWTHHADKARTVRPLQATVAPVEPTQNPNHSSLVSSGYIFAVLMPIIGFVLGLMALGRPEPGTSKHGMKIVGLSIVAFIVYLKLATH
jgi:Protein of unknown function (DUF2510)